MKIYLVGGAVRDKYLGLPVHDHDWVVEGASPHQLLKQGFQQVGKDFPVFLHPQTKEEYALARTERKSGQGYTGFTTHFAPDVTLEQDLLRRDLTINAMAEDANGILIDPYNGFKDLKLRLLRHVSPAFAEDPLRILRVARFAARYAGMGFHIANETLTLMQQMTQAGELENLSAERVWKETAKALAGATPHIYFHVLRDCGALAVLFPEIDALFGIPTSEKGHTDIDSGVHTLMTLGIAAHLSNDIAVRFATLTHEIGKGLTPKECWPHHHDYGPAGVPLIDTLCHRLRVPNVMADLAKLASEYHGLLHSIEQLPPATLLTLFDAIDVWRKPERLEQIALVSEADARGRPGFENMPYPQKDSLFASFQVAASVAVRDIINEGYQGVAIKQQLHARRCACLKNWLQQRKPD